LLEHAGTEVAGRRPEALWETLSFLKTNPILGRVREDLRHKGIRSWRMNELDRWIVFYGVRDHVATVYRVGPER
jgi:hypothetical protein